jgi:hypothetical protein
MHKLLLQVAERKQWKLEILLNEVQRQKAVRSQNTKFKWNLYIHLGRVTHALVVRRDTDV